MVHGIDFLGRRQIVVPQSTNININYGNGFGGYGANGAIFAGRVPYGAQYQFMNNPYGYPPERSGGGFLGKLLLGLGLGFLASKIFGGKSAEGDGKSGNANESGGFFKKIDNLFKSSDSEKSENAEEPTDSKGNAQLTTAHKGLEAANKGLTLIGIVSNNTNTNANTKTSIDNMKKAETSEALLRAINDASKQFDDINADFVQKIDNFNKKYNDSVDGENIKDKIKDQKKAVKEADKEFDAKAKAYNAAEATIKKTESDYKQALDNYNSIKNNIADYKTKANAAGIKDDVKQTYNDNIRKLESDLSTAKKKLDDANKAKQDAITARDNAKRELSESEKKLKNEQTKLNELKNLQNAQEERIDFDKAISKQIKRLEKLSKKENKKMERYKRKADNWEEKSANRAENGRTEGSQRAEDKQTKWQNKLNSTREHHVDFNSGEITILQNNNTSSNIVTTSTIKNNANTSPLNNATSGKDYNKTEIENIKTQMKEIEARMEEIETQYDFKRGVLYSQFTLLANPVTQAEYQSLSTKYNTYTEILKDYNEKNE